MIFPLTGPGPEINHHIFSLQTNMEDQNEQQTPIWWTWKYAQRIINRGYELECMYKMADDVTYSGIVKKQHYPGDDYIFCSYAGDDWKAFQQTVSVADFEKHFKANRVTPYEVLIIEQLHHT